MLDGTGMRRAIAVFIAALAVAPTTTVADERVILKSGLTLQGLLAEVDSLDQNPFQAGGKGEVKTRPILLVDDGLRRVYVHRRGMVAGDARDVRGVEQTIEFDQLEPLGGNEVQAIGDIVSVSPFNQFARRSISVRAAGGIVDVIQGITELNSRYAKVVALKGKPAYLWDMRVATSTIPSSELLAMFRQLVPQDIIDRRLDVVRFFIEAERFREAESELKRIARDFPDEPAMDAQLIGIVAQQAKQLIDEAKKRAEVGQENFARRVYERFRWEPWAARCVFR